MLHSINNLEVKKSQRRKLRHQQTPAEYRLWQKLRGRKLGGHKFYRQFSIGMFILDFYCYEKKLAIELDGAPHKEGRYKDNSRTTYLENHGITVIRFWNSEVETELTKVCQVILSCLSR